MGGFASKKCHQLKLFLLNYDENSVSESTRRLRLHAHRPAACSPRFVLRGHEVPASKRCHPQACTLSSFPLAAVRARTRARTLSPSLTGSRQGHQGREGRGERPEGSRGPGVATSRVWGQTPCHGELVAVAAWPVTQSPASEWVACRF